MGAKSCKASPPKYSEAAPPPLDPVELHHIQRFVLEQLTNLQGDFELWMHVSDELLSAQVAELLKLAKYPHAPPTPVLCVLPAAIAWLKAILQPAGRRGRLEALVAAWDDEIVRPVPNRSRLTLLARQMESTLEMTGSFNKDFDVMTAARKAISQ